MADELTAEDKRTDISDRITAGIGAYGPAASSKRRLRVILAAFFLFLTLPFAVLLTRVYTQLENENYYH